MTREEARDEIKNLLDYIRGEKELKPIKTREEAEIEERKGIETLEMAIEALEQLPEIKEAYDKGYKDGQKALAVHLELCKEEEEPCKDCISRKDAEMCLTADITNMTIEEYISMVGDRLKGLSSIQPTTKENLVVEDCISREAVQNYVESYIQEINTGYGDLNNHTNRILRMIVDGIGNIPSIQPKPKTGHWEWVQYDYNPKLGDWHCSECRSVVMECVNKEGKGGIPLYKYCPQCGAKMEEIPTGSESEE